MYKVIITLGIVGFAIVYFVVIPYMLWKAPTLEEDDYEEDYIVCGSPDSNDANISKGDN